MSDRREYLDAAITAAKDDNSYSGFFAIVAWARSVEDELAKAAPVPSPGNLPELQALINRAERAEARAQELTNRVKCAEDLARLWSEDPGVASPYTYTREKCARQLLRALGKS